MTGSGGRGSFVRGVAVAAVALPCGLLAAVLLWQAMTGPDEYPVDRAFHGGLGLLLAGILFGLIVWIRRAATPGRALARSAAGILLAVAATVIAELFGPPALLALAVLAVIALVALAVVSRRASR